MKKKKLTISKTTSKRKIFAADFETTVYAGQDHTEVWSAAFAEVGTDKEGIVLHSIQEQFDFLCALHADVTLYYHNLKFDGSFLLDYFIRRDDFSQAEILDDEENVIGLKRDKYLLDNEYTYTISSLGQWYTFSYRYKGHMIQIKDSLKLIPFSLTDAGKAFNTKHRKLDMEYVGYRYAGCPIYPKEKEYILNDVYVLRECLEFMFTAGYKRLTVGSCCMAEFKITLKELMGHGDAYRRTFPNLYRHEINPQYGAKNADAYIRKAYKGGWTYLVPEKAQKTFYCGTTADVNSLYPSVMHSDSGNWYPIGSPNFWSGDFIPEEANRFDRYYYMRIKTRFYIKDGRLPCIQIKGDKRYKGKEWLRSSDVYQEVIIDRPRITLTVSCTDYVLITEQYNLVDFEILDGCWFYAEKGIFDNYINKYKEIKMNSTGATRTLAKLFLVNLNGKLGASDDSSQKIAYLENDEIHFKYIEAHNKEPGYIPVGAAITSYARDFTIRAAQKNYYGPDKRGFIYADTDSIHCDLYPEELKGVPTHSTEFNHWKLESSWVMGRFIRQKCYIEYITHENLAECVPYYNVKGSGMKKRVRELFVASITGEDPEKLSPEEHDFLYDKTTGKRIKRTIEDYSAGLEIPGNLKAKRIRGGIILESHTFKMR